MENQTISLLKLLLLYALVTGYWLHWFALQSHTHTQTQINKTDGMKYGNEKCINGMEKMWMREDIWSCCYHTVSTID